jgi:hypothetical protein
MRFSAVSLTLRRTLCLACADSHAAVAISPFQIVSVALLGIQTNIWAEEVALQVYFQAAVERNTVTVSGALR